MDNAKDFCHNLDLQSDECLDEFDGIRKAHHRLTTIPSDGSDGSSSGFVSSDDE